MLVFASTAPTQSAQKDGHEPALYRHVQRSPEMLAARRKSANIRYTCAEAHRKRVRTTDVIERLFVKVRRRIRAMCAFTTRSGCERILTPPC